MLVVRMVFVDGCFWPLSQGLARVSDYPYGDKGRV